MTQKHSSELFLTASGIQHRVSRRTLSMHTAFPLSVILSLDPVMLQTERPQVLRLVGIRLRAEDTPRTYMVHMPCFERDFRAAVAPLARGVITGHDLAAPVLRPFPGLDDQPVLPLGKSLPGQRSAPFHGAHK